MRFKPGSLYYSTEPEIYIPYFDGNKNVEAYLEWETKVDQILEKHQLDEFSRFSMATLSFQEYARSWWTKRETDVINGRKSEVLNWDELKMCMRRKFVPPSYVKKKKLREEMKELVEKGRNFIYREKEYARREKEFREKFQALVRKKEVKEKRERVEKERKNREEKEKREKVMIEKGKSGERKEK
ncbi:protein PXR1-like [Phaseolus vulgaris]|uniref:protein PXR1-like n=1 Tax=Phaseolus vulgaris TaxID=3885 RepID=UPI0035CBFBBA